MTSRSEEFSLSRAGLLTLMVLTVVTAAIALANLSSEPVTINLLGWNSPNKSVQRAYGWPLTWYWRSAAQYVPRTPYIPPNPTSFIRWPVSRYSMVFLAANLAIWLILLAASLVGCKWLLRRYRPRLHWRPRVLTLIVLMMVSAPTVYANLSFDSSSLNNGVFGESRYGWPLIWYWHVDRHTPFSWEQAWDYSTVGLAGNLVLWILMLGAIGLACEWLFRRFRPRLCFNLRRMLVAVALTSSLCAWCAVARDRAVQEDAVVALIKNRSVYYDRWGPKWLDILGADRFRRHIVGAWVHQDAMNDEFFERLARLPDLRFLDIDHRLYNGPFVFTPGMAAALGDMRQLRILNVTCRGGDLDESRAATDECLAAIGKVTQLERLRVSMWEESSDDLGFLANLTNLKTLVLDTEPFSDGEDSEHGENAGGRSTLANLPVLPRLETVDLPEREFGDDDLDQLARFPRLKSLDLSAGSVGDHPGLAKLASLESLEELAIDKFMATAATLEALVALKRLNVVHIAGLPDDWTDDQVDELPVSANKADGVRRALAALRQSHPGIVIDARYREFREDRDLKPPWLDLDTSHLTAFVRRWLYKP